MNELLKDLEAVVSDFGFDKPQCYARDSAYNFIRAHHAEIAEAVKVAAYGRALIDAMNAEYQAAKESRKGGKQEAWITTYILLRRLKVAADHLSDTAMHNSAREGGE